MAASDYERRRFVQALDSTERWLLQHFVSPELRPAVSRMVRALRQYIRQSRRYGLGTRADSAELDRRLKKIHAACTLLWEARPGKT